MKKYFSLFFLLTCAALTIFLVWFRSQPVQPFLLAEPLVYKYPPQASQIWDEAMKDPAKAAMFRREPINGFFPGNEWAGRLRLSDISFQSLFALDNSRIEHDFRMRSPTGLDLAIYNPSASDLTYQIWLEAGRNRRLLWERRFQSEEFFPVHIDPQEIRDRRGRLVLQTSGRGVGAWINPRWRKQDPHPRLVVILMLDTLRADHLSFYGYHRPTSPAFDELARDSLVYSDAYSTTSWTLPAHVSLFSGRGVLEHGVLAPENAIPASLPLFPELFQQAGFLTAAFTGGGFVEDNYGFHRGFGTYSNRPGNIFHLDSSELVFANFQRFMAENPGRDCLIFLHTYQLHAPYKAPLDFVRRFNPMIQNNMQGVANRLDLQRECFKPLAEAERQELIDLYDAGILYADQALLARVVDWLKKNDRYRDSLLVCLSDHGEEFYDHGSWEHGHSLYRELMHIPLLIKFPRQRLTGKNSRLTSISDLASLLLKENAISGSGFEIPVGKETRTLELSLPVAPTIRGLPGRVAFVDDQFSYIHTFWDRQPLARFSPPPSVLDADELFDYRRDPGQRFNRYRQLPRQAQRFKGLLRQYLVHLKATGAPQKQLDPELRKKLKSLGYLAD